MIDILILTLAVLLAVGAGVGYLYRNTMIDQGKLRGQDAFAAWRRYFFDQSVFNEDMLRAKRDALTPGEYLYFEALVKDTYDYYQKNPRPYIRDTWGMHNAPE